MAPASGTYGEGAALARLEAALPGSDASQSQATEPLPPMSGKPPQQQASVPGLPKGLLAPTRQPDVPVSTPLPQANDILVGSGPEKRIALLEALVASPELSQETKEFATNLLGLYKRAGRG